MTVIAAIHWKTNFAPRVRGFSERQHAEECVRGNGDSLDDLHEVNGEFIYWPRSRGAFPDAATLTQWETEYLARPVTRTLEERVATLEATTR